VGEAPDPHAADDALAPVRERLRARDYASAESLLASDVLRALPGASLLQAQAAWGAGRHDEALAAFRTAAALAPDHVDTHTRLAQALVALGESVAAEQVLAAVEAREPGFIEPALLRQLYALDHEPLAAVADGMAALAARAPQAGEVEIAARALAVFCGREPAAPHDFGRPRANARWRAVLHQARHCPPARLFGTAGGVLRHALEACTVTGLTLEFGVYHGRSLRQIAAQVAGAVHGFDSFQGLPEDWTANDPRGSYSTGGRLPDMPPQVRLHAGWFEDTLPGFLAANAGPVRFAHVDCDLYSSSRTVLTALAPRLVAGSVLLFDDFLGIGADETGEARAFRDYVEGTGRRYEYLGFTLLGRVAALRML
jgi:hypothetical protein